MLIDLARGPAPRTLDVDICIIGAGPAGISIAAEYIGTRRSVALVEAGFQEHDEATQMLNLAWATGRSSASIPSIW